MNSLLKKLNEPFPDRATLSENIRSLLGIALFVTLFLYLIRPFGLHTYPKNPFWICLGFGGITFIVALLHDLTGQYVFKLEKDLPSWTLWKWIVDVLFLILLISIGNYLFMLFMMNWSNINWIWFLNMIFCTLLIGIFPIVFSGMMIQMNAYKRNQLQADDLQTHLYHPTKTSKQLTLSSNNKNQSFQLEEDALLYLESMQNYVAIHSIKEGKTKKLILRNTIQNMEKQLEGTTLIRCHRSFIVNTQLIEQVTGNAQGLRLKLNNLPDAEIPVSRKYIPALKQFIGRE